MDVDEFFTIELGEYGQNGIQHCQVLGQNFVHGNAFFYLRLSTFGFGKNGLAEHEVETREVVGDDVVIVGSRIIYWSFGFVCSRIVRGLVRGLFRKFLGERENGFGHIQFPE